MIQNATRAARGSRRRQYLLTAMRMVVPSRWLVVSGPPGSSTVYLTFDDGPHPTVTPDVLRVLREYDVHATFFLVGKQVAAHPDLVRQIADDGHAIGSHSYNHERPHQVSSSQLVAELRQTQELLREVLAQPCRLYRPPYGKLTAGKLWRLWREQQRIVLWNRDPRDYLANSAWQIVSWFRQNTLVGGDIILLHDKCATTAQALPVLIEDVFSSGLGFGLLD